MLFSNSVQPHIEDEPTATLGPGDEPTVPTRDNRGLIMPKRRRTRAENLARRIEAERNKPPPF
jgi:hypothetical protein